MFPKIVPLNEFPKEPTAPGSVDEEHAPNQFPSDRSQPSVTELTAIQKPEQTEGIEQPFIPVGTDANADTVSVIPVTSDTYKGKVVQGGRFYQRYMFTDEYEAKEKPFIIVVATILLTVITLCVILSFAIPDTFGSFYKGIWINFAVVSIVELIWKTLLAAVAYRYAPKYKRTINYTRKLGNLVKLYKYFLTAYLLPEMDKKPLTLIFVFSLDQLIFTIIFSHNIRRRNNCVSKFLRFVFLQQDRPEDRPDTLIYQVTEDLMRFAVYIPFQLFIYKYFDGNDLVIMIPLTVNSIGDGLAEPVGIFFTGCCKSRCKRDVTYRTKSLYTSEGGFCSGSFVRSYPGSFMVFITTVIILIIQRDNFNRYQYVFLQAMLPYWMTITEAFAPHTNDGPFIGLLGCGMLSFVLLYL